MKEGSRLQGRKGVREEIKIGKKRILAMIKNIERARKLRKNQTPQEIILWSRLRRKQLGYKFTRQKPIGNYIVDFVCFEKKLIIEVDGWQHKEEFSGNYEKERTRFLERKGYKVIRFWNSDINTNLDNVIFKIVEYLEK